MLERDRHVTRSGEDYAGAFSQLLPQGLAWPRTTSSVLMQLVRGLGQVWGYVETRASDLLERESDPRITLELLPDWERNWGLPDPCYYDPDNPPTFGERQTALIQRMTIEGAQSRAFFIAQAAYIGYKISISEYRPFMVGIDRVGDNRTLADGVYGEYPYILGPPENRYYWTVHVDRVRLTWFRTGNGGGQTGVDPHLRIATADDLECLLNRWRPAHTQIIFDYSGLQTPGPMSGTPGDDNRQDGNVSVSPFIDGVPTIPAATIAQRHALSTSSLTAAVPSISAATIAQRHALSASALIDDVPSIGAPAIGFSLDFQVSTNSQYVPVIGL